MVADTRQPAGPAADDDDLDPAKTPVGVEYIQNNPGIYRPATGDASYMLLSTGHRGDVVALYPTGHHRFGVYADGWHISAIDLDDFADDRFLLTHHAMRLVFR